jgi:galactokinase
MLQVVADGVEAEIGKWAPGRQGSAKCHNGVMQGRSGGRRLVDELTREFEFRFGRSPESAARAPGRVNLIGEHTDYNLGLVLPMAIDRDTVSVAARRSDGKFGVYSQQQGELRNFEAGAFEPSGDWIDYVRGVVRSFSESGQTIPGLDIAVSSEVPLESGLSSSAALCVSLVTVIDEIAGFALAPIDRARLAHRAESEFVGVGCGIMDPFASALGSAGSAVRIDCRTQEFETCPVPQDLCILVANSGTRRSLVNAGYRERVAECQSLLALAVEHGIAPVDASALRDLSMGMLPQLESILPSKLYRRARHVITENTRVDSMCAALRAGNLAAVGAILKEGMKSLQSDYEVSTPQLDRLCEVADATTGVYGSRLTGAGFGGCTIHLLEPAALPHLTETLTPLGTKLHAIRPAPPASALAMN